MSPLLPVRSTAKKPQPRNRTPGARKTHPHRARFATLHGQQSAAESGPESIANRTWIRARIGGPGHPESGTDRHRQDGKAAPQIGAAREPNPQLKKNSPNRITCPPTLTRSRIARPGRPGTQTEAALLGGRSECTWLPTRPDRTARRLRPLSPIPPQSRKPEHPSQLC